MNVTPTTPEKTFIANTVARSAPTTTYSAETLKTALSALVWWFVQEHPNADLTNETVLSRSSIALHITSLKQLTPASRGNRRSQLLRIAEAVLGPELALPRLEALPSADPTAPYTAREVRALVKWATAEEARMSAPSATSPTSHRAKAPDAVHKRAALAATMSRRRQDSLVLLALGLGAGLSAQEIGMVRCTDVIVDAAGVLVRVSSGRTRSVPVLPEWESVLKDRVLELNRDGYLFRNDLVNRGKNLISSAVADSAPGTVRPQSQRMRSTWLVRQMTAGTSLTTLVEAAGIESLEALTRYLRFVPKTKSADSMRALRAA
jgi:hypothetical protein